MIEALKEAQRVLDEVIALLDAARLKHELCTTFVEIVASEPAELSQEKIIAQRDYFIKLAKKIVKKSSKPKFNDDF